MKFTIALIAMTLVGCSSTGIKPAGGISLSELERIRVVQADCPAIDQRVAYIENQLRLRGTSGKNPEDLSEEDRRYNSAGKVIIWSLRIGCNNPNRYQ
jgi:hypothetical protein